MNMAPQSTQYIFLKELYEDIYNELEKCDVQSRHFLEIFSHLWAKFLEITRFFFVFRVNQPTYLALQSIENIYSEKIYELGKRYV